MLLFLIFRLFFIFFIIILIILFWIFFLILTRIISLIFIFWSLIIIFILCFWIFIIKCKNIFFNKILIKYFVVHACSTLWFIRKNTIINIIIYFILAEYWTCQQIFIFKFKNIFISKIQILEKKWFLLRKWRLKKIIIF